MTAPRATAGLLGAIGLPLGSLGLLKAGFLAAGLLVAAAVLLAALQQGDDARLRHSLAIEVAVGDVLSTLQDAQIGQRG